MAQSEQESDRPSKRLIDRRSFLRGVGVAGAGAAVSLPTGVGRAAAETRAYETVFRRSHKGEQACRACRRHDKHRYYRLRRTAQRDRPHLGCNCDVIHQLLPRRRWRHFFVKPDGTLRAKWDTRWGQ